MTRVHRLELDNQRLQQELDEARNERDKEERERSVEKEMEGRKTTAIIARLGEQVKMEAEERTKLQKQVR